MIRYPLAALGAWCLLGHLVLTWGWPLTLWVIGAPFVVGFLTPETP